MAIAFDGQSGGATTGTSLTVSHTITTGGANTVLVAYVVAGGGAAPTSVTYNGTAMSQVGGSVNPVDLSNGGTCYAYYLFNPASGTHDIVSSYASSDNLQTVAASYTGVTSTGFPNAQAKNASGAGTFTSTSVTVTSVTTDNCLVVAVGLADTTPATYTAGANTVKRASQSFITYFEADAPTSPAGAKTLNFSISGGGARGGMAGFAMPPAVASGPANVKTWDGVTQSTGIKTYQGVTLASVKSVNGIT